MDAPSRPKTHDIECLRCGAFNLPENRVCGRCGASLPVVYDPEGRIFNWREAQGFDELMGVETRRHKGLSPVQVGWLLRGAALLAALLAAFFILRR